MKHNKIKLDITEEDIYYFYQDRVDELWNKTRGDANFFFTRAQIILGGEEILDIDNIKLKRLVKSLGEIIDNLVKSVTALYQNPKGKERNQLDLKNLVHSHYNYLRMAELHYNQLIKYHPNKVMDMGSLAYDEFEEMILCPLREQLIIFQFLYNKKTCSGCIEGIDKETNNFKKEYLEKMCKEFE